MKRVVVFAVVACLALGACSGDGGKATGGKIRGYVATVRATSIQGGVRSTTTNTIRVDLQTKASVIKIELPASLTASIGTTTTTSPAPVPPTSGFGAIANLFGAGAPQQGVPSSLPTSYEMLVTNSSDAYMRLTPEMRQYISPDAPPDKLWVAYPSLGGSGGGAGALSSMATGGLAAGGPPSRWLASLRKLAPGLKRSGEDQIGGAPMKKFVGMIDYERWIRRMSPMLSRKQFAKAVGLLQDHRVPLAVWVGSDGLLYRVRYTFAFQGATQIMVSDFQYGDVRVDIPAPGQVYQPGPGSSGFFGGGTTTSATFSCTGSASSDGTMTSTC